MLRKLSKQRIPLSYSNPVYLVPSLFKYLHLFILVSTIILLCSCLLSYFVAYLRPGVVIRLSMPDMLHVNL
jgi:hypothetical protein